MLTVYVIAGLDFILNLVLVIFHHFLLSRSVVVPVKKPPPGSLAVTTVGATAAGSGLPTGSTSNIFAATGATPKSMINTTGIVLIYFCDTSSFSFCFLYLHFSAYLILKIKLLWSFGIVIIFKKVLLYVTTFQNLSVLLRHFQWSFQRTLLFLF